ncbi:meckelin isoform X1 [Hydra vulgaris]|uniref:meckelin isoform X1 n=1 Tax=Hydra vulgaris TaxID=6087 RepID=UPI001F5F8683|nr:meckelin [Hydra vulgaris]
MFSCQVLIYLVITSLLLVETLFIPFTDPSKCQVGQYFQFSSLRCINCDTNQIKSQDGLSCVCANGFRFIKNNGGLQVQCTQCDDLQVQSSDGWSCINCPTDADFNMLTKTCNTCSGQSIAIDRQLNGELSSRQQCLSCQNDTQITNTYQTFCKRCDQSVLDITGGSCQCPVGVTVQGSVINEGGKCLSSQTTPFINSIPSIYPLNYVFLQRNIRVAQALCNSYQNFTACQLLGNLCVLHMYNTDNFDNLLTVSTDPCKEFLKLQREYKGEFNGNLDWPATMPWLYYTTVTSNEILSATDIKTIFSRGQLMQFVAVKISASGKFLGITTDIGFLNLCQNSKSTSFNTIAFTFPTTYKSQCKLSISSDKKKEEMVFYDLYMLIDNLFLYPVPVLVANVLSGNQFINQGSSNNWKMTRRFFLLDNLSGLTNPDKNPDYFRYASSLQLRFMLRGDGLIFPPVLHVKYTDVQFSDSNSELAQEFNVLYEMNTLNIIENIKIAVGTLSIVAIFYAVVRIVSWRRRMGSIMLDCNSFIVYTVFLFSGLSLVFWMVSFFACFLWLIIFKNQTTVIFLLPTADQEVLIKSLLVAALIMKFIDILHIIYNQINVDMFIIDWERPRGVVTTIENGSQNNVLTPVSIIRTLFVANEWQELQAIRRIKPTLQLVLVLLFLKVFGFEYLCTTDPITRYSVTSTDYVGEYSFTLRFAVISFLFFGIAITQSIIFGIFYERFISDSLRDFVDFCSLSNISLFIMPCSQYGFYIHGRSIHGRSDTSLHELFKQFQREEENLCGKRGLEPNSDHQVFEFTLTSKFRLTYEKILQPLMTRNENNTRRNPTSAKQNPALPGSSLPPFLELSVHAYETMNKYLTTFIEHALRDNDYIVKEKLLMEKLFNLELQSPLEKSIFYNDERRVFTEVLLYGQEWNLLLFTLLFYLVVDWLSGYNTILAVVLSYFIDSAIVSVRHTFGKKNLARKTMVDQRFLI